jgi:hypothetical protein
VAGREVNDEVPHLVGRCRPMVILITVSEGLGVMLGTPSRSNSWSAMLSRAGKRLISAA